MPALKSANRWALAPEVGQLQRSGKNCPYLYMHSEPAFRDIFFDKYFSFYKCVPMRDKCQGMTSSHAVSVLNRSGL
jgi:hypothetical protein